MSDRWEDCERKFTERPVRTGIIGSALVWVWVATLIVLVGLISIGLWAFGVFTSDVKGQGDALKIRNEAANRIRAQEGFETLYHDIQASDRIIVISSETLKTANGADASRVRTELTGQKQYCTQLVGQYNAKARQFRSEDFRAADLPSEINQLDTRTDCKE